MNKLFLLFLSACLLSASSCYLGTTDISDNSNDSADNNLRENLKDKYISDLSEKSKIELQKYIINQIFSKEAEIKKCNHRAQNQLRLFLTKFERNTECEEDILKCENDNFSWRLESKAKISKKIEAIKDIINRCDSVLATKIIDLSDDYLKFLDDYYSKKCWYYNLMLEGQNFYMKNRDFIRSLENCSKNRIDSYYF
jgi:hypothetical protein